MDWERQTKAKGKGKPKVDQLEREVTPNSTPTERTAFKLAKRQTTDIIEKHLF
jgi:hypothetical protein